MGKVATIGNFDTAVCPLLAGLTSEEQQALIASDARLRACIAAVNDTSETGPELRKLTVAYASCQCKAEARQVASL